MILAVADNGVVWGAGRSRDAALNTAYHETAVANRRDVRKALAIWICRCRPCNGDPWQFGRDVVRSLGMPLCVRKVCDHPQAAEAAPEVSDA